MLALAAVSLGVLPSAKTKLPDSPAVFTVFLTLAWSADALTAFLFVIQGRIGRSLPRLVLASGYAYSSLLIVLHGLTFPGVFAPSGLLGADTQSAIWFWVAWHGGFPFFIIAYAFVQARPKREGDVKNASASMLLAVATIVAAVVALVAVVVLKEDGALPILIREGHFDLLTTSGVGPAVMVTIVAAIASLICATRLRRVTDVWLTVALFASLLDCLVSLASGRRYTLGWDVARGESLVASTIVLLTFLRGVDVVLRRLAVLSSLDGLTSLANRRAFDETLAGAVASCARTGRPLSVLLVDVDSFKKYNDSYGHQGGDETLRVVADCISQILVRRDDFAARYGGEEFAVVLPATDIDGAVRIAERLRQLVLRCGLEHRASSHGLVTISIGAAMLSGERAAAKGAAGHIVSLADDALYRAKATGRNRVESSGYASRVSDEPPALRQALESSDSLGR